MKKLLGILMIVALLFTCAAAEGLSSMSYDELIALHQQLVKEIMSRPEWREVTVPAGTWVVGEDIPAGTYSISSEDKYGSSIRVYTDGKEKDFLAISGSSPLGKYTFENGQVLAISRAVVFAPPVILGF